jgi:hypothetical protein
MGAKCGAAFFSEPGCAAAVGVGNDKGKRLSTITGNQFDVARYTPICLASSALMALAGESRLENCAS